MKKILTRSVRKYIYGVAVVAIPVLAYFDVMEPAGLALMLPLLMALLNLTPADVENGDENA